MHVPATPADKDAMTQLLLGEFAIGDNDLKRASAAYGKAAQVSREPAVAERAAALAIAAGDEAAARRAIDRWQSLGAGAAGLAQARAELALSNGDTEQAKKQLLHLVAVGGQDAWRTVGRVLMHARDPAQAGIILEAVATTGRLPEDAQAWLAMSELADRLGRHAYAQRLATQAVQRFHSGETYAWAAQLKLNQGDRKAARALYAKAYARDPKDAHVRIGYAVLLGRDGDNRRAERVLAQGPQTSATYAARAGFASRGHDIAALKRLYAHLSHANASTQEQNTYLLGQLADILKHPAAAIRWYAQVSDDDPHAFDADMRRAYLLDAQGRKFRAHALLDQVRMDNADQSGLVVKAYRLDASLYMRDGNYAEAANVYSEALKLEADDAALRYGRAMAYAQSGRIDAAIADWKRLLERHPDNIDAANALGYTLADANRNLPEAEKLLDKARAARPQDPAIMDSWGWLQYRLGHFKRAVHALEAAWQGRKDAEVGAHLAQALWKSGDHAKARHVLAAARKLDAHSKAVKAVMEMIKP